MYSCSPLENLHLSRTWPEQPVSVLSHSAGCFRIESISMAIESRFRSNLFLVDKFSGCDNQILISLWSFALNAFQLEIFKVKVLILHALSDRNRWFCVWYPIDAFDRNDKKRTKRFKLKIIQEEQQWTSANRTRVALPERTIISECNYRVFTFCIEMQMCRSRGRGRVFLRDSSEKAVIRHIFIRGRLKAAISAYCKPRL